MKQNMRILLVMLAFASAVSPLVIGSAPARAATTRHFDIYMNNATAGCPNNTFCFNTTNPGPTMSVNQGDTVSITVHDNDTSTAQHTFTITAYSVNVVLTPGTTQAKTFTANTSGQFTYECTIHPTTMKGTLSVAGTSAPVSPTSVLGILLTTTLSVYVIGRRRR